MDTTKELIRNLCLRKKRRMMSCFLCWFLLCFHHVFGSIIVIYHVFVIAYTEIGGTATGDLNFISIEQVEPPTDQVIPNDKDAHDVGLNPFSTNLEGQETSSAHIEVEEVEHAPSGSSGQKGDDNGKKRKQIQIIEVLESYLEFKKEQTKKIVEELNETTKSDEFLIGKCVAALESIEDLTDMEKAKALRLFKCELNREIFINSKNPSVCLLWIKSEIAP